MIHDLTFEEFGIEQALVLARVFSRDLLGDKRDTVTLMNQARTVIWMDSTESGERTERP